MALRVKRTRHCSVTQKGIAPGIVDFAATTPFLLSPDGVPAFPCPGEAPHSPDSVGRSSPNMTRRRPLHLCCLRPQERVLVTNFLECQRQRCDASPRLGESPPRYPVPFSSFFSSSADG